MARVLRIWAISEQEKNLVRNLQYGPRTRLVRGIDWLLRRDIQSGIDITHYSLSEGRAESREKCPTSCEKKILLYNVDHFLLMVLWAQHTHDPDLGWVWIVCYFHFYMAPEINNKKWR